LPVPLNEIDDDFLELFFDFANTYTEDSILTGFLQDKQEQEKEASSEVLKELGYTDEDLLSIKEE